MAIGIKIGTRFQSAIADGNPFWKVTRKVAAGAWEAVCDGEDYGGTVKLFSSREITAALQYDKMWKSMDDEQENFYSSLKEGQTIHYCNGFKQYVECVVVKDKEGKNALKPVALKGEWPKYDLPQRLHDGSISSSYHVDKIKEGSTWRANYTCIVEHPKSGYHKEMEEGLKLPRINLDLPEETERQKEVKAIMEVLTQVHKGAEGWMSTIYRDDGTSHLEGIKSNIASMLREAASKLE